MISRHHHIWKIESRDEQPSPWDQMTKGMGDTLTVKHGDPSMFLRSVIVTYKCEACGSQKVERV